MNPSSDTPRTDDAVFVIDLRSGNRQHLTNGNLVSADFARSLEHDLTAVSADLEKVQTENDELHSALEIEKDCYRSCGEDRVRIIRELAAKQQECENWKECARLLNSALGRFVDFTQREDYDACREYDRLKALTTK